MHTITQADLLEKIVQIFPNFAQVWHDETCSDACPSDTLHSVYMSFLPFVGSSSLSDKQWIKLAKLLDDEVAAGGDRENAVDTCFLEHCKQVSINKKLSPLVSKATRVMMSTQSICMPSHQA